MELVRNPDQRGERFNSAGGILAGKYGALNVCDTVVI